MGADWMNWDDCLDDEAPGVVEVQASLRDGTPLDPFRAHFFPRTDSASDGPFEIPALPARILAPTPLVAGLDRHDTLTIAGHTYRASNRPADNFGLASINLEPVR